MDEIIKSLKDKRMEALRIGTAALGAANSLGEGYELEAELLCACKSRCDSAAGLLTNVLRRLRKDRR